MPDPLVLAPVSVTGYHGCTQEAAESILSSGEFRRSREEYDWLGEGFYFFEFAPFRAWQWAQAVADRVGGSPAVIEARVELGRCVNLLDAAHMDGLPDVYGAVCEKYEESGLRVPRNTERGAHFLDQEVVNLYCDLVEQVTSTAFQTVRGCFPEGEPVYEGSKILKRTHVQIAVRDPACISELRQVPVDLFREELTEHA
jgi:hypothetical protein